MITRMERPTATMARFLSAPSGDAAVALVEEGVGAPGTDRGLTNTRARSRLPCPVALLPFFWSADSLTPGAKPAQDARCAGVGTRVMSRPFSAMIACASVTPTPRYLIQPGHRRAERGDLVIDPIHSCTVAMSAVIASTRPSIRASRNA